VADVLLTHSYHLPYDPKQVRKMQPYPPLGTLYAASSLHSSGMSVAVFDTMLQDPGPGIIEAIRLHQPKIVVIYEDDFNFLSKMCLTRMREVALQIAATARSTGAVVIAHGSDASDHAQEYLTHGVDFILLGEAEQTLSELCSSLLLKRSIDAIPGLVRLTQSGHPLNNTPKPPLNPSWVSLPKPARELIDLEPYRKAWSNAHGYFSTSMVASRGCPYRCNWCAKPISGNKFQVRPASQVAGEMRELKDLYGAQHLWFGDDVFALNHRWTEEFALEVQAQNAVLPFKIQSRADLMTEANVSALRDAGCAEVWMGVESGSQKILNAMDKGLQISDVLAARSRLAKAGIRACYFLQFGYPGETWEDILLTIDLIRSTRPYDIGVSFSYPLPGTVFYERVRAQLGSKQNWAHSDDLCLMFRASYTDTFYRALRDALHAEVDSWHTPPINSDPSVGLATLWQHVANLESISRNHETTFETADAPIGLADTSQLIPLASLMPHRSER
jgi:anaerobic magnesium-protoporphyrin IX monomethyl ester cyclase